MPQKISISLALAQAIARHLQNGGSRLEADLLLEHLVNQMQADQAAQADAPADG